MRISDWSSDVCSSDLAAWRDPRIAINRIGVRLEHVHRKSDMRQETGMVAVRPDRIDGARGKRLQHQPPDFLLNLRIALHFCRNLGSNLWPHVTQVINEGVQGGAGGKIGRPSYRDGGGKYG